MKRTLAWFLVFASLWMASAYTAHAQQKDMTNAERHQVDVMLSEIAHDVAKHYYDPKLHGVNWDEKVAEARQKIAGEKSLNMAMAHIAAALDSLNDSHTFFVPPSRPYVLDHGWAIEMIGDGCYVTGVRPGGDAETHGVKAGDQVLAINGYRINRDNLWRIEYAFNVLRPLAQLTVTLRNPQVELRKVELSAKFRQRGHVRNLDGNTIMTLLIDDEDWFRKQYPRTAEYGSDLLIAKLPSFMITEGTAGQLTGMARKHKALILDLRGNPGGEGDALKAVIGGLFDHEVKIGDRVGRDFTKPMIAKSIHQGYAGKIIVLIDSKSGSAAELLARVMQLEKRGTVIGDRSAGAVMEAIPFSYSAGIETLTFFGASITEADVVMTDGNSLEHNGVTPDEVMLPAADDLAHGRDPVLAHAAKLAGVDITPEAAGMLFPYQWPDK